MRLMLFFSPLLLTACGGETITVNAPPPPAEYLTCSALPDTPDLSPLTTFEASNGAMVYYKAETNERDTAIARYIVALRGAWFDCSNQLGRVRDYVDGTE